MEQILSTVSDTCPLTVDELARLATCNVRLYLMQWPRFSILWDPDGNLDLEEEDVLLYLAECTKRLHGCGRPPAMVTDHRGWAQEDRCRAAWAVAANLSSIEWEGLESRLNKSARESLPELVSKLVQGLVEPSPWACMSTAAAILELVSTERGCLEGEKIEKILNEFGIGKLLAELLQHTSTNVQHVALLAVSRAKGGHWLGLLSTNAVPAIISIVQSPCLVNKKEALLALDYLAEDSSHPEVGRLKVVIADVVNLLQHERSDIKFMALQTMWSLVQAGDDFAIETCKHGCVPKLIELGWNGECDVSRKNAIECLESLSQTASIRPIALEHGILPLLLHSLREHEENVLAQLTEYVILKTLLSYSLHLPRALRQCDQRQSVLRQLVRTAQQTSRIWMDSNVLAAAVLRQLC